VVNLRKRPGSDICDNMRTQNISGPNSSREQWTDRVISLLTGVLILMLFVFAPLQAVGITVFGITVFQVLGFVSALVLIGGVFFVSASPIVAAAMVAALAMAVWAALARLTAPSALDIYLLAGAWLIMSMVLIFVVGRTVFASGRVNYHRIVGAILVYLSIATTFVSLLTFVGLLIPKAFSGMQFEDSPAFASNVIYFSFVTLTSTGYGDIFPVHPVARSLCNFETILGQLYPATLLARLVSLEIEGRR
jgi:Ion channel